MAQAAEAKWQSPYYFAKDDVTVVLTHHLDQNIRCGPNNHELAQANGGFGKFAQWKVGLANANGEITITLKNVASGDYLRISKNGDKVNAGGKGGGLCKFKVHRMSTGVCKLESVNTPGAYIAVNKKDGVMVGKGGPLCRLEIMKEGAPPKFTRPYLFMRAKTVVIEHRDHKFVRIGPNDNGKLNSEGGKGELAQWEAIPSDEGKVVQFKSAKTGEYLRIRGNGEADAAGKGKAWTFFTVHRVGAKNEVRLESQAHKGKFLALEPKDNTFGSDEGKNRKSIFTLYRDE